MRKIVFYIFLSSIVGIHLAANLFENLRSTHFAIKYDQNQINTLSNLGDLDHFDNVLSNILIERVVGTPGHDQVRDYIIRQLRNEKWFVQKHSFTDTTPFGRKKFENIIATLNPNATRFLVLACHYDSKYEPGGQFLGATDSAVPCAMMLNLIHVMSSLLNQNRKNPDLSLKLIFFDGEEAFVRWGPTDSIYGARKLAKKLAQTSFEFNNQNFNELDRIDMLVLLDLLGAENPKFYNYMSSTRYWYSGLVDIEKSLYQLKLLDCLPEMQYRNYQPYFNEQSISAHIEDDHIPFMKRGVPILHVIPSPFPNVWHTLNDNYNALDLRTVENLNKIFRVFVAKYLHLNI